MRSIPKGCVIIGWTTLGEKMGLRDVENRENGSLRQSGQLKSSLKKKHGV